jgi:hypothetical protein
MIQYRKSTILPLQENGQAVSQFAIGGSELAVFYF